MDNVAVNNAVILFALYRLRTAIAVTTLIGGTTLMVHSVLDGPC